MPDIGKPLYISNSQVQSYKDCQRKWYLAYYRELAPKRSEIAGPLGLGTKVHLLLEAIYTSDDDPLDVLNALYDEDFAKLKEWEFGEDAHKALTKEKALCVAMVEGFLDWRETEGLDDGYEVISNEEVLTWKISSFTEREVYLRGKLDQRIKRLSDGAILFNDWKTTKSFTDKLLLVLNEQMKFYHLLEYLTTDGEIKTDGARYTMLRKVGRTAAAKPPFYKREEIRHNKAEIENFYMATMKMAERIVEARDDLDNGLPMQYVVPPRPSRDCSWKCPFVQVCPLFDDGSNVELALSEHFVRVDPDARYNTEEDEIG